MKNKIISFFVLVDGEEKSINKSKVMLLILICILAFVGVCYMDNLHQKEFYDVSRAVTSIENGEYDVGTIEILENYLNHSELYWLLNDKINQESIYTREFVKNALDKCYECQDANNVFLERKYNVIYF